MDIISRSQWGAQPWRGQPYPVSMGERTHFLVHYHGGPPPNSTGTWVPRNVEAIHLGNGWSGVGYNFLVDQDGRIYEGRGWGLVGAHCPGKNRTGIGVYVAVGGNQEPTDAAKRAVVWLYDEAQARAGRALILGVHGDWYSTKCAGPVLDPWVHAGMPLDRDGGAQDVEWTPAPKPKPTPEPDYYDPPVKRSVKSIQRIVGVTADGYYGDDTKAAVKKYQAQLGIVADGLWGAATERAHKARKRKPKTSTGLLRRGSKGSAVKRLQKGLNASFPAYSRLVVDGDFGPATERVVKEFQRRSGLSVDGIVGAKTRTALARYGIKA